MTAILDPRITFTRSGSVATRFNASGLLEVVGSNVPRFDYDPVTLAARGLLIEEQRTNLHLQSSDITTTWTVGSAAPTRTADAALSPSGANDADALVESSGTGFHTLQQGVAKAASSLSYTWSYFIKRAAGTADVFLQMDDGSGSNGAYVQVDPDTGAVGSATLFGAGFSSASASTQAVGNDWHRVSLTATSNTATSIRCVVLLRQRSSFTGDGVSGVYLWGSTLEQATFPTSYIPTTTAQVTRTADIATVPVGSWYNQVYGTWRVRGRFNKRNTSGVFPRLMQLINAGGKGRLLLTDDPTTTDYVRYRVDNSSNAAVFGAANLTGSDESDVSVALAYAPNDFEARGGNGQSATDTSGTIGADVTTLYLGSEQGTVNFLNGYLRDVDYYPRRLSGSVMATLVSA